MTRGKIKARAAEVGARPDVQRWVARLQEIAREMPSGVCVYVASGLPCVMATDADGRRIEGYGGGMSADAVIATAPGGTWDGGDW